MDAGVADRGHPPPRMGRHLGPHSGRDHPTGVRPRCVPHHGTERDARPGGPPAGQSLALRRSSLTSMIRAMGPRVRVPLADRSTSPVVLVLLLAAAIGVVVLTVAAARASLRAHPADPTAVLLSVAIGPAFVVAGAVAPGAARMRVLTAMVGVAWLLGVSYAPAELLHQGALALALAAWPLGRWTG